MPNFHEGIHNFGTHYLMGHLYASLNNVKGSAVLGKAVSCFISIMTHMSFDPDKSNRTLNHIEIMDGVPNQS